MRSSPSPDYCWKLQLPGAMDLDKEAALKAKADAEKKFAEEDYTGVEISAIKAQMLCPGLEGISQMALTFGVYSSSTTKNKGQINYYDVLGLDASADEAKLKAQYERMAHLLHLDRNKTVGAHGAFCLVSEAWNELSTRRSCYDQKLHTILLSSVPRGLCTSWTVCLHCTFQQKCLKEYLNKRVVCCNCQVPFVANELQKQEDRTKRLISVRQLLESKGRLEREVQRLKVKVQSLETELQKSRTELINGLKNVPGIGNIGIKWMGKLDYKPIHKGMKRKFNEDEAYVRASQLCATWEDYLKDPDWTPFTSIPGDDGIDKRVVNDKDEKLIELKENYGDDVYTTVVKSLTEMKDYIEGGRCCTCELWNYKDNRRANLQECIRLLLALLKEQKRRVKD